MNAIDIDYHIKISELIDLLNVYYKDKISNKDQKQFDGLVLKLHTSIVEKLTLNYNLVVRVHKNK